MKMTSERPTKGGWYWWQIPRNRALQPVLVWDSPSGLLYSIDSRDFDENDEERDGLEMRKAAAETLWSDEPLVPPN